MNRLELIKKAKEKVDEIIAERRLEAEEEAADEDAAELALRLQMHDGLVDAIEKNYVSPEAYAEVFREAAKNIQVSVPPITVPEVKLPPINVPEARVKVEVPPIKIPPIKVPKPEVTVNVPPQPAPVVKVDAPVVNFPESMEVGLSSITKDTPLPVISVDPKGNFVSPVGGNGGPRHVKATLEAGSATIGTVLVQSANTPSADAFGRWRTSGVGNRLDIEFNYDGLEGISDVVTGATGTTTFNTNARQHTLLQTATTTGDYVGIYSHDIPYTPGNSQLIAITGVLNLAALSGGVAQIFLRSKKTGTVDETVINQADWNDPVLDVDWSKSQIFEMDFQSLKVGRIRFYLNRAGEAIQVHEILNDNIYNTGYWQLAAHPIYWRLYNDATYTYMEIGYGDTDNAIGFRYRIAKTTSATMAAICGTVKSEGGAALFDMPGFNRTIDMGTATKLISTELKPLISIRPKSTFNSLPNKILMIPIDYTAQTNNSIRLVVVHNATLSVASWTDVDTNESGMEYDITATHYTGGHIINADYVSTTKNATLSNLGIMGRELMWVRRGPETGVMTLAAIKTGATDADVLAGIRWREIR